MDEDFKADIGRRLDRGEKEREEIRARIATLEGETRDLKTWRNFVVGMFSTVIAILVWAVDHVKMLLGAH